MTPEHWKVEMHYDGEGAFYSRGFRRVARRGHRDTPQAMTRVSLEPGWLVLDDGDRASSTETRGFTDRAGRPPATETGLNGQAFELRADSA
jgi:hypothetical protein